MSTLLLSIFFLLLPVLMLYLNAKYKKAWISPIVFCYLGGIILGNLNLKFDTKVSSLFSEISVSLAIPILLFSSNFFQWLKHSQKTFLSFFLGMLSVVIASSAAYFVFRSQMDDGWKVAGMLIGVYTGGTPNMSAIGLGLEVKEEIFVLLNSADIIFSTLYFLILITFAKKILSRFLPPFKPVMKENDGQSESTNQDALTLSFKSVKAITFGIGTAAIILGAGVGISLLLFGKMQPAIIILTITTLGIASSFIKSVHKLEGTYQTAEYLLLIFAVSIGSMANFNDLVQQSSSVFYFVGFVLIVAIILHFLFALIARIDTDTFMITSTAGIFGPAFVGPVADALKNREIIVPGFAMGLLGYALGNYLGLGIALFLSNFM